MCCDSTLDKLSQKFPEIIESVKEQYTDSILSLPHVQAKIDQEYLHTNVLRRMHFHKASTLWRMGRKSKAKPLFKELWEGALKRNDERFLKEIKQEGYEYKER